MASTSTVESVPLRCLSCNYQVWTKTEWKDHLLHKDHLRETRANWGDQISKDCCLVSFTSSLKDREWIVNWFSLSSCDHTHGATKVPKNIVWWDERPRIIIIEFETKEQADAAFDTRAAITVGVGAHVRRAEEFHDLEWLAFFPERVAKMLQNRKTCLRAENKNGDGNCLLSGPTSVHVAKRKLNDAVSTEEPKLAKVQKVEADQIEGLQESSYCPVNRLNDLANSRGWLSPQYFLKVEKTNNSQQSTYLCVVLVNGSEWARESITCSSETEAKRAIAEKALKAILKSSPTQITPKQHVVPKAPVATKADTTRGIVENTLKVPKCEVAVKVEVLEDEGGNEDQLKFECDGSDDESDGEDEADEGSSDEEADANEEEVLNDAVRLLADLARRRGWRSPEYFSSKIMNKKAGARKKKSGKPRGQFYFTCRVLVNGVEYRPPPRHSGYPARDIAMNAIASICLKKLENSHLSGKFENTQEVGGELEGIQHLSQAFINICSDLPPLPTYLKGYWSLCGTVLIPEEQFTLTMDGVSVLRRFLVGHDPKFDIIMIGNWALKLKPLNTTISYEPVLHLHHSIGGAGAWTPNAIFTRIFRGGTSSTTDSQCPFAVIDFQQRLGQFRVLYKSTGVTFTLTTLNDRLLEAQTTRLLQYFCTFDARLHHLIVLAQYWSSINAANFAEGEQTMNSITLPWLAAVFLCHKGYLPTPREVQERPHKILLDSSSGIDIGFKPDPDLVRSWCSPIKKIKRIIPISGHDKSTVPIEVVTLLPEFLRYLQSRGFHAGRNWLLNSKDAEWLNKRDFCKIPLTLDGSTSWHSNMTLKEISSLRAFLSIPDDGSRIPRNEMFIRLPWYVSNPFVVTCRFQISKDIENIIKLLNHCAGRMDSFVCRNIKNGGRNDFVETMTLETLMKVGADFRSLIILDPNLSRKERRAKKNELKAAKRLAKKGFKK